MKCSLRILFISAIIVFYITSWAQQNESEVYIPKVIPPSPTAASIQKFVDIPVSYYTGSSSINVPIYTIESGDISLPITLAYNASGVRVSEEASWVGLGWALNAGGVISRTIMGQNDFNGNYFTSYVPEINSTLLSHPSADDTKMQTSPYLYDFWCNYLIYTSNGNLNFREPLIHPQSYDLEADVYSFNFLGYSGKFIINRNRQVVLAKQDNIKIEFDTPGYNFTITDDKGFKFLFSAREWAQRINDPASSISSWYLSKIISPNGRIVQLNYKEETTWVTVSGGRSQTYRDGCWVSNGLTDVSSDGNSYKNLTLESIDFSNGKIQFYFDNSRIDNVNAKKLNKITIFRKPSATDSTELYSYNMYYSYFNDTYTGGTAAEFKRLRLDSVRQSSGTNQLPPYLFSYYDDLYETTSLTGKNSFSIDHWGYYNGESNTYLFPKFYGYFNPPFGTMPGQPPPSWWDLTTGGNRTPNPVKAKLFSLKAVVYPTGGRSELEMESNDYDENRSFTGPTDFEELNYFDTSVSIITNTRGVVNNTINLTNKYGPTATVTIAFRCSNTASAATLHNTSGQIYVQIFGNTIDINSNSLTLSNVVWNTGQVVYSVPGNTTYNWSTYIAPGVSTNDFQDITVTIRWKQLRRLTYGVIAGGGLRVKSISNYDANGTITRKRKYEYHYFEDKNADGTAEEYSYGRRISHPSYLRYEVLRGANPQGWQSGCMSFTRFSSSIFSLTGVTSGNAVGYDQVTEWIVDPSNESNNLGKTVYQYYNSSDTIINYNRLRLPGINNIGAGKNGQLKSKIDYRFSDGSYYKVAETNNYYSVANRKFIYGLKIDNINPDGATKGAGGCLPGEIPVETEYLGFIYPAIQSEKILLDSTIQITYESNSIANYLSTTTRNTYTPAVSYLQLSKSEVNNSKNETEKTELYYPYDYTGVIYDSMMARNMVSSVIGKKSYSNNTLLSQVKTEYQLWQGNTLILPASVSIATRNNPLEAAVNFNGYDAWGNPTQYISRNGVPFSFIWDYNSSYPIAKITNATAGEIAYTSFETSATGNWVINDPSRNNEGITGDKSFILNNTNSIVYNNSGSNADYFVSYWSKTGAITISGITNLSIKTGLTSNGWTYYEHKVRTTGTNINLGATTANTIDELRLYPVTAQMETFSYLPLVGVKSQCSITNMITYYEYDSFHRLKLIRDMEGNVLKTFEYKYQETQQ